MSTLQCLLHSPCLLIPAAVCNIRPKRSLFSCLWQDGQPNSNMTCVCSGLGQEELKVKRKEAVAGVADSGISQVAALPAWPAFADTGLWVTFSTSPQV